jgi:nitrite reductase/ring-hydroxylating ferredoxin subunit
VSSETSDPSFHAVLDESSFADNTMEMVEINGKKIALIKRYGRIYALDNTCPHLGGSLGRGTLKENSVICPLHHWTFDLATGNCVSGVPDEKVATYETQVENGKILVKWPDHKP